MRVHRWQRPTDRVAKTPIDNPQIETEMPDRIVRQPKSRTLNALHHGAFAKAALLEGEDESELKDLRNKFKQDLAPQGEAELRYFDVVVMWAWRMLRYLRWQSRMSDPDESQYDIRAELDIPTRLSGEYDKAVRRFYQCRATRKMLGYHDDDGTPAQRRVAIPALPPSHPQRDTSNGGVAASQADGAADRETTD
jgi:hypothetical protein